MVYYNDNKDKTDMILFHNKNKFFAWLCEILDSDLTYLDRAENGYDTDSDKEVSWYELEDDERIWLEEVIDQNGANGSGDFEVRGIWTKSKLPECFGYEVEYHWWLDNEEMTDNFDDCDSASTIFEF